jgi:hypothetical protein
MAKINEQKITITVSKLMREKDEQHPILHDEMLATLIAVIQEMIGNDTLIEIE